MIKGYIEIDCDYIHCYKCRFCFDAEAQCWCAMFDVFLNKSEKMAFRTEVCKQWTGWSEDVFAKKTTTYVKSRKDITQDDIPVIRK